MVGSSIGALKSSNESSSSSVNALSNDLWWSVLFSITESLGWLFSYDSNNYEGETGH